MTTPAIEIRRSRVLLWKSKLSRTATIKPQVAMARMPNMLARFRLVTSPYIAAPPNIAAALTKA